MDAAAIGARLASSAVAPLIKKLFVQEGPGAGLVTKPVRLAGLVSFKGEKRTIGERDLHRITGELVQRALRSADPHDRPVASDEEEAVAIALARTLHSLGDLDMDDVQAVQLGHRALAQRLRSIDPHTTFHLSDDAARLHDALVEIACLHILHFFTQRSTFVASTLVRQSSQLTEAVTKVDLLLERNPSPFSEDTLFEARYADHIIDKHGTLTIYGIDLTNTPDQWPLDTAYLSLEAGVSEHGRHTPIRAEHALAGRDRVLLRGVAGSGKTTLVQWLAVTTARQDPAVLRAGGEPLAPLLGRVPFVLPLRTLTRLWHDLPTPGRFLAAIRSPLADAQPRGWTDRVLSAGRGLLLVDGIDEVPEKVRGQTRNWLRDLLGAYPGNLWLITSRPSAVRDKWLAPEGFSELSLAPMSRGDVTHFIRRWHTAARSDDATERELLDTYEQSLITAIRTKQDLARLATNPLMCGLICALHRDRRGYLPHARKELYDAALSMLLSRRDIERHMSATDGIELNEEPQTRLLQKLAYKFLLNGKSELERSHAERIIALALPSVPAAVNQGNAEEIFRHLLLRSGVLREPVPGIIDFVHRTFQDYLGAKAAVEEGDLGVLVLRAADSQWEDAIRMAIAHARPKERADLLGELIARGDTASTPRRRTQLHLLAMASLEHATELNPTIRAEVERRATALIPPKTLTEAAEVAQVGPVVLELLPGPEGLSPEAALLTVQTAVLIGGDAAIPVLARFVEHPDAEVRTRLATAWYRFDTEQYAEEVLARLDGDDVYVEVAGEKELQALRAFGGRARLRVGRDLGTAELVAGVVPDRLTHLWLRADHAVTWYWLAAFPRLHTLTLDLSAGTVDLSSLAAHPALRTVRVDKDQRLTGRASLMGHLDLVTT
ncbi:NACHT domain-containing protein [Wenjunlia tyrosinilytica]|uniref:ATP-binding protein n=1 Tax=Wenjunlia tyrosinilytica TaxID=1544741 RepID=A0A917ZS85_9ACTN|nr:NACHT domain-containing protein [Wenjunlia tyrosinilytica]GGO90027.1 ATP-binding protein [Wenjunlia tyrosinilytica]